MNTNRRSLNSSLVASALALFTHFAVALPGDLAQKWPVNDENPSASIPDKEARNQDPLEFGYWLQDMIARAEGAFGAKDYEGAIRYYEALVQAAPDKAVSFRRLCASYERLGNLRKAEANCWAALKRKGVIVNDHLNLMQLALSQIAEGSQAVADERTRMIDASAEHVRNHLASTPKEDLAQASEGEDQIRDPNDRRLPLEVQVELIECRLAVHLRDPMRLQQCVDALRATKADPKLVVPFQWMHAVTKGDQARVDQVLEEAKALGMHRDAIKALAEGPKTLPPRLERQPYADERAEGAAPIAPSGNNDAPPPAAQSAEAAEGLGRWELDVEAWLAGLAALVGLGAGGWLAWQKLGAGRKSVVARS